VRELEAELCSTPALVTRVGYAGCDAVAYVKRSFENYFTYTVVADRVTGCAMPSQHGFYSGFPNEGEGFPPIAALPEACIRDEAVECVICGEPAGGNDSIPACE